MRRWNIPPESRPQLSRGSPSTLPSSSSLSSRSRAFSALFPASRSSTWWSTASQAPAAVPSRRLGQEKLLATQTLSSETPGSRSVRASARQETIVWRIFGCLLCSPVTLTTLLRCAAPLVQIPRTGVGKAGRDEPAAGRDSKRLEGYASNLSHASTPLPFPCPFSRSVVLGRSRLDPCARLTDRGGLSLSHGPFPLPRPFRYSTFEQDKPEILQSISTPPVPADSPIRMLALCRVLMGKIYVSGEALQKASAEVQHGKVRGGAGSVQRSLSPCMGSALSHTHTECTAIRSLPVMKEWIERPRRGGSDSPPGVLSCTSSTRSTPPKTRSTSS